MYILGWLKLPTFNPDKSLRVKLVCMAHMNRDQANKFSDVCPWLYGLDEETMKKLLNESIKRIDIIGIELWKWFEPDERDMKIVMKEEREIEIMKYLRRMPYDAEIWNDLTEAWGINIKQYDGE